MIVSVLAIFMPKGIGLVIVTLLLTEWIGMSKIARAEMLKMKEQEYVLASRKEEIFSHPIHPYTKSLLSAIPHPNPVVEKHRVALTYNYATSGIGYAQGTEHSVGGTHTPCLRRMKSLTHGRNNVLSPEHAILTLQKQQQRRLSPLLLF